MRRKLLVLSVLSSALSLSVSFFAHGQELRMTESEGLIAEAAGEYYAAAHLARMFKETECGDKSPANKIPDLATFKEDFLRKFPANKRHAANRAWRGTEEILAVQTRQIISDLYGSKLAHLSCKKKQDIVSISLSRASAKWKGR